jgi:hypothetical protein
MFKRGIQARPCRGQTVVKLGSNWGHPRVKLGSTDTALPSAAAAAAPTSPSGSVGCFENAYALSLGEGAHVKIQSKV